MRAIEKNLESRRKVLVSGASGYIGSRLVRRLLLNNPNIRVMIRDRRKILGFDWKEHVEVSIADAKDYESTKASLEGIHTAFYLLHSMKMGSNFENLEAENARSFARAAEHAGVKQIVYLGGIANDKRLSKHMQSRVNTGRLLHAGSVPVMEIRAGIIIGAASASFEMLRQLTIEIPFMTKPKWIQNRTQPICISDVIYYLSSASELKEPIDGIFDIGGPNILTYSELIQTFAQLSGLPQRWIIKLPIPSPRVAGFFIGIFTRIPTALAKPLMGSLISEVVADPKKTLDGIIELPHDGLSGLNTAIKLALSQELPATAEANLFSKLGDVLGKDSYPA